MTTPIATASSSTTPLVVPTTGDLGVSVTDPAAVTPPVSAATLAETGGQRPRTAKTEPRLSFQAMMMLGWAVVSAYLLSHFVRAVGATRRLIRDADDIGEGWLPVDVDALRRAAGVRSNVRWAISPRLQSPAVGGLIRPTVVIPPDLDDGLTPDQLRWVLLHELAHVRRGDLWVVVAQRIAQAVFFFHPAVYLANWAIDQLREYACDDAALAACESTSRRDCGEGFLTVVGRAVEPAPAAAAALGLFESRMMIRRRLVRILDSRRTVHQRLSPRATFALLAAALLVLPYGRSLDASARSTAPAIATDLGEDPIEPASYRPGEVWHREAANSGARIPVLALAYSADGATFASAADDGSILLRDVRGGQVTLRLDGHRDAVTSLAFSPDGKSLASGSYDRSVRLWNVATGRAVATLEGHSNWVFSVAFSPDGKSLASAGHDKIVRVWDLASGRETRSLGSGQHRLGKSAVAFSPDGRATFRKAAGADRVVALWNLRDGHRAARLEGHSGTVRAIAFSPDGLTLATAGEDGEARLWDLATHRERAALSGHGEMLTCVAISPGGQTLATGSLDATVKLWDLANGRERATLQGHHDGVSALAFAPGARRLVSAGFDGSIRFWDPAAPVFSPAACLAYPCAVKAVAFSADGRVLLGAGRSGVALWDSASGAARTSADRSDVSALAVSSDGATSAVGGPDGALRLLDTSSGRLLAKIGSLDSAIRSVAFSPDGRSLVAGCEHGELQLWDVQSRRLARSFPTQTAAVSCVRYAPDGRTIAVGAEGTLTVYDVATGSLRGIRRNQAGGVSAITFAPDGATMASAGPAGVMTLWDTASMEPRGTLRYSSCSSLAYSPDGRILASSHASGEVVLWDVARRGRQLGLLKGHRDEVSSLAFTPDGRSLATAGGDGFVKLWNLAVRRLTAWTTLKAEASDIWSVAYSPDGKTLAVAEGPLGSPGSVTLWSLASRRVIATLAEHEQGVASAVFSPDGKTLASGSWDGTVILWDVASSRKLFALSGLNGITHLAFSPDGKTLATAGEGKLVTLWDVATGDELARLTDFRWKVQCLAYSPDGRFLATGGGGFDVDPEMRGEVKLWNLATRTVAATFEGHSRAVLALAFSPDGQSLASGGLDNSSRIWNVASGELRVTIAGLPSCVQSLGFSRDGARLAWSGRGDGLVAIHDAKTGAEVARLVGHRNVVRSLAFSPDGLGLATGSADRTVRLWDLSNAGSNASVNH